MPDSNADRPTDGNDLETRLGERRHGAVFSEDRNYRYCLWRRWNPERPTVAFVMLNPSTADATSLDPTCRRCRGFAEDWGFGTLLIGNLFGLRSTDPANLADHENPVGPENDAYLRELCEEAETVVVAWGTHGTLHDRGREVARLLEGEIDGDLRAIDTTKDGHPIHPLYQPADAEPEPWDVGSLPGSSVP
jgi:hypothetical protein